MLFAAGLGTRMGDLVSTKPKPLIRVAGKTLIDHALHQVNSANIENTVVNVHFKSDMIITHLAGRDIQISNETDALLDTGGGLQKALPMLGADPVFTLNTDAVWVGNNPLVQLAKFWDPLVMGALLLLIPPQRAFGHRGAGDFLTPSQTGKIARGTDLIYSGAQIMRTEDLNESQPDKYSLNRVWDLMLKRDRLYGLVYGGSWCDVGSPGGLNIAEDLLAANSDV